VTDTPDRREIPPPGGDHIEDGMWVDIYGDPTCWYCRGEACAVCHLRTSTTPCEHDVLDRHGDTDCRDIPGGVQ